MTARTLLLALLAPAVMAEEIPKAIQVTEPPKSTAVEGMDRVISSTGQFRVSGGEAGDRATVAMIAEQTKSELQAVTGELQEGKPRPFDIGAPQPEAKEERHVPVIVALHGKRGDPAPPHTIATKIHVSEAGYQLRIDIHLSRGIEMDRVVDALMAALLHERALRNRPANQTDGRFYVPPWLIEGLREAVAWNSGRGDRRPYETLFKSGGLFKSDDLLGYDESTVDEMDAATRLAFRVSSGSLVMALLGQPQGKEGFRSFLTEVAAFQGEMPVLLRKHFPGLNLSETSLAKWGALQLADIGGKSLATDVLSVARTETELTALLFLDFKSAEGIVERKELSAWPETAALPPAARVAMVAMAREELDRLSYRCFPSYRPVIAEYQLVLGAIVSGKTKDLPARLEDLANRRATMTAKAQRARDYLDWFEITRARETSGAFDDYMQLKERLKANPHHREDNLSKYLDRMDAIYSRGGAPVPPVAAPPPTEPGSEIIPGLPPLPK